MSRRAGRLHLVIQGGDNMLGRAVQLTLPAQSPGDAEVTDSMPAQWYLAQALRGTNALELASIREANANGSYLWGDLLSRKANSQAALTDTSGSDTVRLLNLETAVTRTISNPDVPTAKICYHLHCDNLAPVLSAVQAPHERLLVVLANNHAMDFGRQAFEEETVPVLEALSSQFQFAGVGRNLDDVQRSVDTPLWGAKVLLRTVALTTHCSGTMPDWQATPTRPGLLVAPAITSSFSADVAFNMIRRAFESRQSNSSCELKEVRLVSIHWGPNWAYRSVVDGLHQGFRSYLAHRLIDELGVDIIYGHSSHHIRGIEVYRSKLVFYGAGDFVNDYEGFANPGDEAYCMFGALFQVDLDDDANLFQIRAVPTFMDRLRLKRLRRTSAVWNAGTRALEPKPSGAEELATHINELSRQDCAPPGTAITLRVVETEGGPELVYP